MQLSIPFLLRPACVLSVLLLFGACSASRPAGPPETDPSVGVTDFLKEVLGGDAALAYGDLVRRFGPPVRVRAEPLAGPSGASKTDTLRTVFYYGLEVVLREGSAQSYVTRLALTDARHVSPEGLRVGYARDHVLQALGKPTRQTASQLFYARTDAGSVMLVLFMEHRAVSRIEWRLAYE